MMEIKSNECIGIGRNKCVVITVIIIVDSKICTNTNRKIIRFFLPQCAQNVSNYISEDPRPP